MVETSPLVSWRRALAAVAALLVLAGCTSN